MNSTYGAERYSLTAEQIALLGLGRELLALDLLLEHVQQVHRVRRDLGVVEVEDLRQHLEREPRRQPVHALVDAGEIAVLLHRLRLRVDVLQVLAVVDPHLGEDRGVLRLLEPRQHGELRHHLERARARTARRRARSCEQLLVDLDLFADPQAVGHLDDVDAVEEGLVVLVVLERLPLGLVRVREHDAVERDRAEALGALVVAFLGGGEQRVQHLDRRLEHLDEFEQALVGAAQAAGVAVGVRVVLRVLLELADVELADQRADVLVVLVARLGLADGDLGERRRAQLDDAELREVAAVLVRAASPPTARGSG